MTFPQWMTTQASINDDSSWGVISFENLRGMLDTAVGQPADSKNNNNNGSTHKPHEWGEHQDKKTWRNATDSSKLY